jgi:hypothetical protein
MKSVDNDHFDEELDDPYDALAGDAHVQWHSSGGVDLSSDAHVQWHSSGGVELRLMDLVASHHLGPNEWLDLRYCAFSYMNLKLWGNFHA